MSLPVTASLPCGACCHTYGRTARLPARPPTSPLRRAEPSMTTSTETPSRALWDQFDPGTYLRDNYRALRADDRQILALVRDFFTSALDVRQPRHGIDVGSGPNLGPALAMLPWVEDVVLYELGAVNVEWLDDEVPAFGRSWDAFWAVLTEPARTAYRELADPRRALAQRARVHPGSVFDLPDGCWDLGTMFFCAESITGQADEFEQAVGAFLGCLRPWSPFAAAFMTGSVGYQVGDVRYPAVNIDPFDISRTLKNHGAEASLHLFDTDIRPGHGMVLATGWTAP